jgi:hypothetical protein
MRRRHRTGPRMQAAADFVAAHPGCAKIDAARHVAPHGTALAYGYRSVDRAIAAGLVTAAGDGRRYALTLPGTPGEGVSP